MNIEQIDLQGRTIALEAMQPSQVLSAVTDRLPGFVSDITQFFRQQASGMRNPTLPFTVDRGVIKKVGESDYRHLRQLSAHVPPGLSITYLDYLGVLDTGMDFSDALLPETVSGFNKWLGLMLSSPERLSSFSGVGDIRDVRLHDTEAVKELVGDSFNKRSSTTEVKFGDVVRRAADWKAVAEQTDALATRINKRNPKDVIDGVEELTTRLDTLLERLQEDPDTYALSGRTLKEIAELSRRVAGEIEFYSVLEVEARTFVTAIDETQQSLKKALR